MEVRRPILVASNVLITKDDKLLLGQRKDCNLWETPGGKVEAESVVDAAVREMREENGVELLGSPKCLGVVDGWEWSGQQGRQWYVCVMLLWDKWRGAPDLREGKHHEWRWFPLDLLPQPEELTYGTRDFVEHLMPDYTRAFWQRKLFHMGA